MEEVQWRFISPYRLPLLAGMAIVLLSLVTNVFWMFVGWRAMRTHERIAADLRAFMAQSDHKKQ